MPGKRTFNPRRAKIHRSYTVEEVARLYGVVKGTVRNWVNDGLPALTSRRPHLILGADLRGFLETRRDSRRQKLTSGELYCLRCRAPRRPAGDMLDFLPITLLTGNLRGICPECDCLIHRRVSLAKIDAVRGSCLVAYPQGSTPLTDMSPACLDCHLATQEIGDEKTQ